MPQITEQEMLLFVCAAALGLIDTFVLTLVYVVYVV